MNAAESALPQEDGRLARRSRWLLLGLTLPLALVVLGLAAMQYRDQRRQVLQDLAAAGRGHALALNSIAKQASDHVAQMKAWSEGYLTSPPSAPSSLREFFTPRTADGKPDGFTLDAVPPERRGGVGQLLWFTGDPRRPATGRVLLDQALDFFGLVRLTHNVTPFFQWSYFFSADRNYVAIYPWAPSADVMAEGGERSLQASVAKWFDYEIFKAGTPGANAARTPYWTEPYVDAFGAGAMVSLGAPVYVKERFSGVVGTDVKLATMDAFVHALPREVGRLWLLDGGDRVLTDSARPSANTIRKFSESSPPDVDAGALAAARSRPGSLQATPHHWLVTYPLADAPWTLVYGVSDREIWNLLLPRFVPYGVIIAVLALNFFLALFLLRRELITPALKLARHIQRVAHRPDAAAPRLPPLWQPVADVVSEAMAANRLATRKLQESEAFKSAIVDNALLAVVTMDESWRIVEFNRAAEAIFGYSREHALRHELVDLLIPPAQRGAYREALRRYLASQQGEPDSIEQRDAASLGDRREIVVMRADGELRPIEMSISATRVSGTLYLTAFGTDIGARKEAEREMASQREALRQSEKLSAMGALLAGVAHELNNPLSILMGRSALLERKAIDPLIKADALKIHAAADRCGRIVRTFLAMARQRPAERRRVQLSDVVAGAVDLVGYNLRSSGIEVEQQFDTPLPALSIDADQIGQVVVNLLINAQQALTGKDEPRRVSLSARRSEAAVVLRVADNGPGIDVAIRERIFDPFFTTKPEGTGTGVGLSVSRAIVREHGGELHLVPSIDGAAFELELPLATTPESPSTASDESPQSPLPAGVALVVDDEDEVAQLLGDVLRSAGCEAVCVTSGREALAWLDAHACSFILCDIRMPDMDGPALWRALQQRHPRMLQHLAFITGDTLSASVAPFLRETGVPSLEKPFTPEEVLELVVRIETA